METQLPKKWRNASGQNGHLWFRTHGDDIIHYNGKALEKFYTNPGVNYEAGRGIAQEEMGNV